MFCFIIIYFQIFDLSQEDVESVLKEICSNSDSDVDLPGGNSSAWALFVNSVIHSVKVCDIFF